MDHGQACTAKSIPFTAVLQRHLTKRKVAQRRGLSEDELKSLYAHHSMLLHCFGNTAMRSSFIKNLDR